MLGTIPGRRNTLSLTLTSVTDSQPFSCRSLRRCSGVRARLCHFVFRRPDCLLRQEDRPFTSGQANCAGARLRKRHLVGPSKQAHGHRRTFSLLRVVFSIFLCFGIAYTTLAVLLLGHTTELLSVTKPLSIGHEPRGNDGCCETAAEMTVRCCTNQPDVIGDHRLHKAYPLFPLGSLNCGRWKQNAAECDHGRAALSPHAPRH